MPAYGAYKSAQKARGALILTAMQAVSQIPDTTIVMKAASSYLFEEHVGMPLRNAGWTGNILCLGFGIYFPLINYIWCSSLLLSIDLCAFRIIYAI